MKKEKYFRKAYLFEGDSMKKSALKYVDYNHTKFTYMQLFMECFKGVCLIAVISYLFYRSGYCICILSSVACIVFKISEDKIYK